ncbi:DUF4458 domain-containing protein [Bacteroides sp. 14(A)]|uniref:DUF4458 domain-containing protein n=1 Tax=Bacteroides sp. 14(A) TaxID=1163670 RepID=UPI000478652B|nr:DUF4458 domain-containing protein [Bacteroides sp. 14(A)]
MRLNRFSIVAVFSLLTASLFGGCSDDDGVDNRDRDYGYIQFKLYKEVSYTASEAVAAEAGTRAVKPQLDYLAEACKIKVTLSFGETTIAQTLTLSAADAQSAEFGLRSDKIKLLTGTYKVVTYTLYDAYDEPIYNGSTRNAEIRVIAGGLTQHDLTVDVAPRGKVTFTLVKDPGDFPNRPDTRATREEYTFDEIAYFTVTVRNKSTVTETTFEELPMKFSQHFDDDDETFGYQTSSSRCDSLLSLPAGDYTVVSYRTLDKDRNLLESNTRPKLSEFSIEDNRTTEAKPCITLYEADSYIQDGYALYRIWKALGGENWYYSGENYAPGTNWDFNKDPDLWCDQPGVQVHSNGRVARIDISSFGFRGHMPAALGQLTELIELYLGTHNDGNLLTFDPSLSFGESLAERGRNRMDNHKKFLAMIHPATQFSEPCARALVEHDLHIPAISLYDEGLAEREIIDPSTGRQRQIRPMDMVHGKLTNGLLSLPEEIGKLKKLEYLFIANSAITKLPDALESLDACTDVEVYNCPDMVEFPMVLARMKSLVSLNISNNSQWSAGEIYRGMNALADGPAKEEIQILYARENNLEEIPQSFSNLKKIGLLDLAKNRISKLHPLGKEVAPVQLYLDYNLIEEIPLDHAGVFCGTDDVETLSFTHNQIRQFPNMFSAKSLYTMATVDFSYNEITDFPADFRGIKVETLTLACNPLTKFPKCLAETDSSVSYIILRGCQVDEIPGDSFAGENSSLLVSMDLSYNRLTSLPSDFTADDLPYLYGLDISCNSFGKFPWAPLNCPGLTVFAVRGQRNDKGERCLKEWPSGIAQHTGLRGFYIGSNDLRKVDDQISYLIYHLDISDNPNITFDASDICYYWKAGVFYLVYDKTQNITGCESMLD